MNMDSSTWTKLLVIVISLASCSLAIASRSCHPLSITTCSLPFPSNFYTQIDSDSSTGKIVNLKGGLLSAAVENKFINLSSTESFESATGFSSASPIMIELSEDFDENSLPIEGGQKVLVFDQDTGLLHPIRTKKYHYAEDNRFSDAAHIIDLFARSLLEFFPRYTSFVTTPLLTLP